MSDDATKDATAEVMDRIDGDDAAQESSEIPSAAPTPPSEPPAETDVVAIDADPVETDAPETPNATATTLKASDVEVVQGTGKQKVRGEIVTVKLPHYKILIRGRQVGVTSINKNKHVCATDRILESEETAILAAVSAKRDDGQPIAIVRSPSNPK